MKVNEIEFTQEEINYYSKEFAHLTQSPNLQKKLSETETKNFLKTLKLNKAEVEEVWNAVRGKSNYLSFYRFMAAMRLCSAKLQGCSIEASNCYTPQKVLLRKSSKPPSVFNPSTYSSNSLNCKIQVKGPTLVNSGWFGTSSYYIFDVITHDTSKYFHVKRRFRDLDWLHNQLCLHYKGHSIPPLPDKKVFNRSDTEFLNKRRKEMQTYLNLVYNHSVLCKSQAFEAFIKSHSINFEYEKKQVEELSESVDFVSLEDTFDQLYAHFQTQFAESPEFPPKLLSAKAQVDAYLPALWELSKAFSEATEQEVRSAKATEELLDLVSIKVTQKHFNTQTENELKEQIMKVEGLQNALRCFEATLKEYKKLQHVLCRKIQKSRSSIDQETAAAYSHQISEQKFRIQSLAKDLTQTETNITLEAEEFQQTHESQLHKLISGLVAQQCKYWNQQESHWSKLIKP